MQKKAHAPMPVHYVKECGAKVPWTRVDSGEMLDSDHILKDIKGQKMTYTEAVRNALAQALRLDEKVFVMGQGINDEVGMFGATTGLYKEFGEE